MAFLASQHCLKAGEGKVLCQRPAESADQTQRCESQTAAAGLDTLEAGHEHRGKRRKSLQRMNVNFGGVTSYS